VWEGKQIVSADWVKQSLTPAMDAGDGWKYGFQWWLLPHGNPQRMMFAGLGFGGQTVQVVPEENVIMVFTGWNILGNTNSIERDPIKRILPAVRPHDCALAIH
jgi:CubicO group peptidase (beta-lactamase class C family)